MVAILVCCHKATEYLVATSRCYLAKIFNEDNCPNKHQKSVAFRVFLFKYFLHLKKILSHRVPVVDHVYNRLVNKTDILQTDK